VLTALAVFAFAGVAGLTRIALSDWGRSPDNKAEFLVLAAALGVVVAVLLGAACVHAFRTAQLTFSHRNPTPESD